jgi:hypothetical protein
MKVERADVERVLGRAVSSYDVEPIDAHLRIHSVTGGVFRVRADGDTVVIKIVRQGVDDDPGGLWVSGAEPSHRNYWKREWLAFDSGLLDSLPGRLRAPRTLLTTQVADDECWIWMADVGGRHGATLELDDYTTIGYDLGTTQGAFTAGELPEHEWLSRRWLRGWMDATARLVDALRPDAALDDSRLTALRPLRQRILALWESRSALLAIVESAPQTVVHCDFWPANLFVDQQGTTAIDWSQVGIGALAQDLDQITLDTVWMQARPDESLDLLESLILPAYGAGLRDSGMTVDDEELHRWYAAAAAGHYVWMAGMLAIRAGQPEFVAGQEDRFGRDYADLVTDRARVVEHALVLGEAALGSAT